MTATTFKIQTAEYYDLFYSTLSMNKKNNKPL